MTLKPCPNPACRQTSLDLEIIHHRWECDICLACGPADDESGEKWNALLRVEDVEDAFREGEDSDNVMRRSNLSNWIFSLTKRDLDRRMKP